MGWMYHDPYGAATGLLKLLNYVNNNPAPITGIEFYVNLLNTFVGKPPPILAGVVLGRQIALVGGYPTPHDYAASVGCAVMYGVLALIHLFNFLFSVYRGHYFYMTLGWILVCIFRVLGFSIRAIWSQDITRIHMALAGEFFLILGTYINLPFTILMAQRLFTWRHPVGGSRKLFIIVMIGIYIGILILAGAVVFAHFVPYLHSLSESTFTKYWDFEIAISILTSVIIGLYVLISVILTIWRPTIKDERLHTYQPWWIESFSPFYFPPRNAAQKADKIFMRKHSNHRDIVRVIAATPHKYSMVEGLSNERGNLKHNNHSIS